MKKLISMLVVLALVLSFSATVFATGGAGFQDDPYVIDSLEGGFEITAGTSYMDYDVYYKYVAEKNGTIVTDADCNVWFVLDDAFSFTWATAGDSSIEVEAGDVLYINICNPSVTSDYTAMLYYEGDEVTNGGESTDTLTGTLEIESYGNAEWTAPQDGYVKFTIDIPGATLAILNGYSLEAEGTDSVTVQVTAGTTYGVYPGPDVTTASTVTWEYIADEEPAAPEKQLIDLTGTVVGACSGNATETTTDFASLSWWSDGRPDWKPLGNFVDGDLETVFSFGASPGERADLYLDLSNGGTGSTAIDEFTIYHGSQGDVPSVMVILVLEDGTQWSKTYETYWVQFGGHASVTEIFDETMNAVGMYIWQNGSSSAHFGDIEIYQYVSAEDDTTVPSGSALALGDNNVTLTYATMPMAAAHWTYTATADGFLTVTVTNIDGNSNLGMAFGRGMYALLVGETDGMYTNTATVAVTAGETVNIAVTDSIDMTPVSAVLNLEFEGGAGGETPAEKNPADYFLIDENGYYVIDNLESPVEIFVGNDDINYIYTAEADGVLSVEFADPTNNNIWYIVNGDNYYGIAPDSVSAGDVILLNIWSGFEGTVTLTTGEGGGEGGEGGETPVEKNPADYFEMNADGHYVIESLPADIFVGNDDINYVYTATADGTVTVVPSVDAITATNCWISVNGDCTYTYAPVDVVAGDIVTINIWSGYEGTVTLGDGSDIGGGEGGDEPADTLPSGSELNLGDNNVTLTYATTSMMAPYWTFTATQAGYLTVTVPSINGNTMLDMAFGRGMYTLLVGETDGMYTNTATVYMNAGDTVKVAVLDTMDMTEVPAILNVVFESGEPVVEESPSDYFEVNDDGHYVIDSLESPVDIFVGEDDIYYVYVAEADGVLSVEFDATANNNIWYFVNGDCLFGIAPDSVAAGDVILLNVWSGFKGTVTLTAGEGDEGGEGGEGGEPGENVSIESGEGTISEIDAIEIFYTPTADGVLTVDISADPGFKFWVFEAATDASLTLPESGESGTYTYNLEAGVEYRVYIIGYYEHAESAAVITYDVSFAAQEIEQPPVDIDKSDVILELGDNNVDLLENTIVSLYEFTPAEPGIYTITVGDGVTMSTYTFTQYLIEEAVNGVIEHTATAAEQTVLIGLSAETASVTVTIEKTGSYTPPAQIEYETYEPENTVVEECETPDGLENIDITVEQNVVLGDDGYYHLGTADGPVIYVNLNNDQFTLANLYGAGAPITMRGVYVDEDGVEHYYDFINMIGSDYYSYSLENDYHPLNADLMIFLKAYGTAQGWYNAGTSYFEAITSGEFEEESAWLASCYIAVEDDTDDDNTGDDNTGDDNTGDDNTGDDNTDDDTTDDDVPADTGSIGIFGAIVAMAFSAVGGAAVVAKKKEF